MCLAPSFPVDVNALATVLSQPAAEGVDWGLVVGGLALIALALFLVFVLKRIIVNSVLGVVALIVAKFLLGVDLPLVPTLIVSIVFGLAGVGTMLLLYFLGVLG